MTEHDKDFCSIDEALEELRAGRMIVLVDDEHRENEGDLVIPAETITPQAVNFIIRNACGRLCLAMTGELCEQQIRMCPWFLLYRCMFVGHVRPRHPSSIPIAWDASVEIHRRRFAASAGPVSGRQRPRGL